METFVSRVIAICFFPSFCYISLWVYKTDGLSICFFLSQSLGYSGLHTTNNKPSCVVATVARFFTRRSAA